MNRRSPPSPPRLGVTLIEVLVSLAIVGVLLAVATPSLSDFMERRRVVAAANEVADIIHFARSERNVIGNKVILHFDIDPSEKQSCVALVTASGVSSCKCYETPICTGTASVLLRSYVIENARGVSFQAHADSWGINIPNTVALTRNQAMTDAVNVQITVAGSRSGAHMRVEMNGLGRVRLCSPGGSIGGYPKC
jgi:type IV fimbrial biogenesis protein FimT